MKRLLWAIAILLALVSLALEVEAAFRTGRLVADFPLRFPGGATVQ